MRLFDGRGVDAAYDRYLDPPDPHEDDSCETCHKEHIQEGVVVKNATERPRQFQCCVDAVDDGYTDPTE